MYGTWIFQDPSTTTILFRSVYLRLVNYGPYLYETLKLLIRYTFRKLLHVMQLRQGRK